MLIDFDVARVVGNQTISMDKNGAYHYVGTKPYSAPEQFINPESVDKPADVFALGVVLYELLTGQKPYKYGNHPGMYKDNNLPPLKNQEIPNELLNILSSTLDEKPSQRITAATLIAKLKQLHV